MNEIFHIVPAADKTLWWTAVFGLIPIVLLGLFGFIIYSTRNVTFEVSPEGLRIRGDLYGRMVPASALDMSGAKRLGSLDNPYRPKWRTNGIGLPGYLSGWFRLRCGEKALLFVTDWSSTVYVPTRNGYAMLMSVRDPDRFLQALQTVAY